MALTFFDRLRVGLLVGQLEGQGLEPLFGGLVPNFVNYFVKSDQLLAELVQRSVLDEAAGINDQVFGNTFADAWTLHFEEDLATTSTLNT